MWDKSRLKIYSGTRIPQGSECEHRLNLQPLLLVFTQPKTMTVCLQLHVIQCQLATTYLFPKRNTVVKRRSCCTHMCSSHIHPKSTSTRHSYLFCVEKNSAAASVFDQNTKTRLRTVLGCVSKTFFCSCVSKTFLPV